MYDFETTEHNFQLGKNSAYGFDWLLIFLQGYGANIANLLSVPIYTWACIITVTVSYIAAKHKNIRGYINLYFLKFRRKAYQLILFQCVLWIG